MTDKAPTQPEAPERVRKFRDCIKPTTELIALHIKDCEAFFEYIDALLAYATAERERAEKADGEVARLNGLYLSAIGADAQGGNDAKQI